MVYYVYIVYCGWVDGHNTDDDDDDDDAVPPPLEKLVHTHTHYLHAMLCYACVCDVI